MQHQGLKLYKVNINGDPGLTLTYFTARSTLVTLAFLNSGFISETNKPVT